MSSLAPSTSTAPSINVIPPGKAAATKPIIGSVDIIHNLDVYNDELTKAGYPALDLDPNEPYIPDASLLVPPTTPEEAFSKLDGIMTIAKNWKKVKPKLEAVGDAYNVNPLKKGSRPSIVKRDNVRARNKEIGDLIHNIGPIASQALPYINKKFADGEITAKERDSLAARLTAAEEAADKAIKQNKDILSALHQVFGLLGTTMPSALAPTSSMAVGHVLPSTVALKSEPIRASMEKGWLHIDELQASKPDTSEFAVTVMNLSSSALPTPKEKMILSIDHKEMRDRGLDPTKREDLASELKRMSQGFYSARTAIAEAKEQTRGTIVKRKKELQLVADIIDGKIKL